ncbi:GNAT family N-acetyltransferase [Candidatus Bipolaricaulota bacterium]
MAFPIETDRLRIRRFVQDDIADIQAFTSHSSVAREVPNIPYDDPAKLAEYIEEQARLELFTAKKCVDLAIERKADNRVLGLLSVVSNGERQAEIGWALGIEHRDRGLVTEAARALITYVFTECGYHRVFAGTVFTNERSWAVMERLGMRKEAHFRKAHVPPSPGAEWIDSVRYAVLAEEWPDPDPLDHDTIVA